jgi:hypothetical protein
MRGLRQEHSARVVIAGHGLVQNLRRGHDELAVEDPVRRRLAVAFDELAWRSDAQPASPLQHANQPDATRPSWPGHGHLRSVEDIYFTPAAAWFHSSSVGTPRRRDRRGR